MKKELKKSNRHRRLAFQELDDVAAKIIQRTTDPEPHDDTPPKKHRSHKALALLVAGAVVAH